MSAMSTLKQDEITLLGKVALILMIAFTAISVWTLPGCGTISQYMPDPGAPTCKEIQAHVTEVGCFDTAVCSDYVETIKREFVYSKLPEGVPFDTFCDFAVSKMPTDCVMQAQDPAAIVQCVEGYLK